MNFDFDDEMNFNDYSYQDAVEGFSQSEKELASLGDIDVEIDD